MEYTVEELIRELKTLPPKSKPQIKAIYEGGSVICSVVGITAEPQGVTIIAEQKSSALSKFGCDGRCVGCNGCDEVDDKQYRLGPILIRI